MLHGISLGQSATRSVKYLLTIFLFLLAPVVAADTTRMNYTAQFKGSPHVKFDYLTVISSEQLGGSGTGIALSLNFQGLTVGGRSYGAKGAAQIGFEAAYVSSRPVHELTLKGGYCPPSDFHQYGHYAIGSLRKIIDAKRLKLGGQSGLDRFGCQIRAYVGSGRTLTPKMLLDNVTSAERDFILFTLVNAEMIINRVLSNDRGLTPRARAGWQRVKKDFWVDWYGNLSGIAQYTRPFLGQPKTQTSRSSEPESIFCSVRLDYSNSPFDQGLDDPVAIQKGLIASGFLNGKADGIPGPKTCTAFIDYIAKWGTNGKLNRDQLISLIAKGRSVYAASAIKPVSSPVKKSGPTSDQLNQKITELEKQLANSRQEAIAERSKLEQSLKSRDSEISMLKKRIDGLHAKLDSAEKQQQEKKASNGNAVLGDWVRRSTRDGFSFVTKSGEGNAGKAILGASCTAVGPVLWWQLDQFKLDDTESKVLAFNDRGRNEFFDWMSYPGTGKSVLFIEGGEGIDAFFAQFSYSETLTLQLNGTQHIRTFPVKGLVNVQTEMKRCVR